MSHFEVLQLFTESLAYKFFFLTKIFTFSTNSGEIFTIFARGHNGQLGLTFWYQDPKLVLKAFLRPKRSQMS